MPVLFWLPLVGMLLGPVRPSALPGTLAPRDASPATNVQAREQPRFRAGTTLIEVDAIVRDRDGRFVADLTPEDFEVLEDGVPEKVEGFYVVVGGQARGGPPPAVTPPLPPLEPPPPAPPQGQRVFVLFFDQAHMAPGELERARTAAETFVANDFQPGDVGGIVNGGTMINNCLTSDREELRTVVRSLKPVGDTRSRQIEMREWPRFVSDYEAWRVDYGDEEVLGQVVARACVDDSDQCAHGAPVRESVLQKARQLVNELRAAGTLTIRTLTALANGLATLPGRKTIVLLSDGFFAEDSWANMQQLTALAARASVRVYAIDTRGLNRGSASSDIIDTPPHGSGAAAGTSSSFDVNADAPNSLAVDTGGLMIRNENDFAKAFHEIADDTSSYYVLGYRPTNTSFDGTFRQIAVRVKRPGLNVRARRGYLATADLAKRLAQPTAASAPAAPVSAAPVREAASPAGQPAAKPQPEAPAIPSAVPAVPDVGSGTGAGVRMRPSIGEEVSRLENLSGGPATKSSKETAATGMPPAVSRQARDGWDAYQRGDVTAAKEALSAAAADPAAAPWVHYTLGWSQFALAEYPAASTAWEHVRKAVPEFEPVYFDLADSYLQQHEFGKAIAVLRDAAQRWADDVEVLNALGVVQTARGAVNDAIESFEQAVALAPNDATSCYNLAKTYEVRYAKMLAFRHMQSSTPYPHDRELAIEYYRKTVQLGGPFAEAAAMGLKRLGAPGA